MAARTHNEARALTILSLYLVPITGIITTLVVILADTIKTKLSVHLPITVLIALFLYLVSYGWFWAMRFWVLRGSGYTELARLDIVRGAFRGPSQLLLGFLHSGSMGLIGGEVLGQISRVVWLRKRMQMLFRETILPSYRDILRVAKNYRVFPLMSVPSSILDAISTNIVTFAVAWAFGAELTGIFVLTQKFVALPINLLAASIADVYQEKLAKYLHEDASKMLGFTVKVFVILAIIAVCIWAVLTLAANRIIPELFGKQWQLAGDVAVALAPWFAAQFAVSPISRLIFVVGGQSFKLVYDVIAAVIALGVPALASYRHWDFIHTVKVLGVLELAAYLLYFLLLAVALSKANRKIA